MQSFLSKSYQLIISNSIIFHNDIPLRGEEDIDKTMVNSEQTKSSACYLYQRGFYVCGIAVHVLRAVLCGFVICVSVNVC
jgi:hypothetical protein